MKQETLYLKVDQNILVHDYHVKLEDIAKMECTDPAILRQLKQKKIYSFPKPKNYKETKEQIQVFSTLKLVQMIHEDYPNVDVQNMGEKDFIIMYKKQVEENKLFQTLKTIVLSVVIFFGASFTIMAFNNDISITDVFDKFYTQVMGNVDKPEVTELEISYCIGLAAGILLFFNHVGRKKITMDPTPIQVELRKYEKDIDTTFIENAGRDGKSMDVD